MKLLSHVIVLAVGFVLGIYVARGPSQAPPPAIEPEIQEPGFEAAKPEPAPAQVKAEPVPAAAPSADLAALKAEFERLLNQRNLQQANLILIDMEKAGPQSQIFLESQGRYLVSRRDYPQARLALKRCLAAFPKSQSCLIDMAATELQVGTKEEQAAAVTECLRTAPTDMNCRNMSGLTFMNSGDYNSAIKIYQELIRDNGIGGVRFDPGLLDWQLALALEAAGRQGEALDHFEKSCQGNYNEACDKLEDLSGGGYD